MREGKIRYYGFSDVPAWYASRAHTLAEQQGIERPIGLQLEYSLVERNIEREHIPAARELGMGICPWSPLASGFLAGKYTKEGPTSSKGSRLDVLKESNNPVFNKFTERNWKIVETVAADRERIGPLAGGDCAELGGHAAGSDVNHHRRHQPEAAGSQPELDHL